MDIQNILNQFPSSSSDLKIICNSLQGVYNVNLSTIQALHNTAKSLVLDVEFAIDYFDDTIYTSILNVIQDLENKTKEITETLKIIDSISKDTLDNIKEGVFCDKLVNVLPESLATLILESEFNLVKAVNDLIKLPLDVVKNSNTLLTEVKTSTLKDLTGDNYTRFLQPFILYKSFILDNTIHILLETLSNIETCLINPNGCNLTRDQFINKDTNQLWSQYYYDQFYTNKTGTFQFFKLISDQSKLSKITEIITRSQSFIDHS